MSRDLNRITAHLNTMGLTPILIILTSPGGLREVTELSFPTFKTAKTVQRLLYNWLRFHSEAKERVSMRLNTDIPLITLTPTALPERRGRKE